MDGARDDAELFADALERPADGREAFLVAATADAVQRERIRALLRAHDRASAVLATPAVNRAAVPEVPTETVIGPFKLVEKLGEGGCGVVWMAQQERPVRRRVALKVIKLGMDTREVIARFEAERQALALMDHPNIATVYEAGATEAGRPYFAMELVHGLPITRYCDERQLGPEPRLRLFVQVCRALQHAHERGVVHRDIKPSNVLVTHDGDAPLPKVIDFGIAKATQGRLTDRTLFTAFEQFLGTPAYMSPEQADFNAQEVDARSDVYALGALLYELLAGRPPFDPKTLASHGLEQVRRIIREVDPLRPSTQLHALPAAERTTLARQRGVEPRALELTLKGDLDWIALKALEKNRTRRYASAAALAEDVGRFLAHKPVAARPPSVGYVLAKFGRRHRGVLLAAAALAVVAALGTVVSLRQARRADRAEREKDRLVASGVSPVSALVGALPPEAPARPVGSEARLAAARAWADELREDPGGDLSRVVGERATEEEIAQAIEALDAIDAAQRWPGWARDRAWLRLRANLAERRMAQPTAIAQMEALGAELERLRTDGDDSDDATVLLGHVWRLTYDPIMQQRLYGPHPDANKRTEALRRAEALVLPLLLAGREPVRARQVLAEIQLARGEFRYSDAQTDACRRGLAVLEELPETDRRRPAIALLRGKLIFHLARTLPRPREDERLQEVLATVEAVRRERPGMAEAERVAFLVHHRLRERGQIAADRTMETQHALEVERLAYALHRRDPSSDDDWYLLLVARRSLADLLNELGRCAQALAVLHRTAIDGGHPADQAEPSEGGSRRYIKGVLEAIARLEAARGNFAVAGRANAAQASYSAGLKVAPDASLRAALTRDIVGAALHEARMILYRGEPAAAEATCRATLAKLRALLTGPDARVADRTTYFTPVQELSEMLMEALLQQGRLAEVEPVVEAAQQLHPKGAPPLSTMQRIWLAQAQARLGKREAARATLAPAMESLRSRDERRFLRWNQREQLLLAVIVEAQAHPETPEGAARRRVLIDEATERIAALSEEQRQLYNVRLAAGWLAAAR